MKANKNIKTTILAAIALLCMAIAVGAEAATFKIYVDGTTGSDANGNGRKKSNSRESKRKLSSVIR